MTNDQRNPNVEARTERAGGFFCSSGFVILSSFVLRGFVLCLLVLWAIGPSLPAAAPFFCLRETTLGYHGPAHEITNLTEARIGWFGPTNLNDPLTGDLWWAANQAIREANEERSAPVDSSFVLRPSSFKGLPIRLIARWAVDPWGTGVSQLTRMVYDEQPLALLGSVDSASTHLAEQVVAKANLPLVSPIATDKSVTLAGVPWMFSCAPSDAVIARALADAVLAALEDQSDISNPKSEHRHNFALLAGTDHESRMTTREVLKEFSRRERMPDFRFDVQAGAQNIIPQLSALVAAQPRAVLVVAGAEDSARWARAVRERLSIRDYPLTPSLSPKGGKGARRVGEGAAECSIFGTHTMSRPHFLELAGSAAEGARFPLLFAPDSDDADAARFIARFKSERQHPPDYTAALTYDATRLLIEAIRRAGPNRARVREELVKLSPWPGIAGPAQFDGTGQNTRTNVRMGTIRNGAIVPLDSPAPPTQAARHTTTP